jgi:hypothetical protein
LYAEALKLTPEDAQINYRLGLIEVTLKGAAEALPRFEAAIQFKPGIESHWVAYIDALIQTGALETAASALEWGQKYGLRAATAADMAATCVKTLECKLSSRVRENVTAYTEADLAMPAPPPWPSPAKSLTANLDYLRQPNSKNRRYVIYAPLYRHNSAGIKVLYELQKWLILAGFDSIVIAATNSYPVEQFADDIVIYPEVVFGNPLKAKRVVRYVLNFPGKLGGEKQYAPGELLIAYSAALATYTHGKILHLPSIESFFYSDSTEKTLNAVYVGKGKDLQKHPKDCVYITSTYPSTRRAMAELLRKIVYFYTYDDFSVIADEAKACGCQVKFIDGNGVIKDFPHIDLPPLQTFKAQLHDFIEMTKLL